MKAGWTIVRVLSSDFQRASVEALLHGQRHGRERHSGEYHIRADQQHPAWRNDDPQRAQHRAAVTGSHGRNVFDCFLPSQVQKQRLLSWKGEQLNISLNIEVIFSLLQ